MNPWQAALARAGKDPQRPLDDPSAPAPLKPEPTPRQKILDARREACAALREQKGLKPARMLIYETIVELLCRDADGVGRCETWACGGIAKLVAERQSPEDWTKGRLYGRQTIWRAQRDLEAIRWLMLVVPPAEQREHRHLYQPPTIMVATGTLAEILRGKVVTWRPGRKRRDLGPGSRVRDAATGLAEALTGMFQAR